LKNSDFPYPHVLGFINYDDNIFRFFLTFKMPFTEPIGDKLSIKATTKLRKIHSNNLAYLVGSLSSRTEVQNVVIRCSNAIELKSSKIVLSLASQFFRNEFLEMGYCYSADSRIDLVCNSKFMLSTFIAKSHCKIKNMTWYMKH